jgi:hypothetical protein
VDGADDTPTTHEVPGSAWVLGWACLAGQVVSFADRGATDLVSALVSVPLSALAVAWVSWGVLRARTVRTWLAAILLLLVAVFALLGLAVDVSLPAVLGALVSVVAVVALLAYTRTDWYADQRTETRRRIPALQGLVVLGGGNDVYQDDNGGDDTICAGPGDDAVSAVSPGADVIDLGSGDDWAQAWYQSRVTAGPGDDTVIAGYTAVVTGGPGRDELKSEIGSPLLLGGPGDDHLQIGLSTPDADGGRGSDSVSFWFGDRPVRVNLAREVASSPGTGSMRLAGVEDVDGTAYDDVLRGSSARNVLRGLDGDDRIVGRGGRDRAEGGAGRDTCAAEVRVGC